MSVTRWSDRADPVKRETVLKNKKGVIWNMLLQEISKNNYYLSKITTYKMNDIETTIMTFLKYDILQRISLISKSF